MSTFADTRDNITRRPATMSRPSSTSSFYASKALSLHSSTNSGRNSPSGLANFIGSRHARPVPLHSRGSVSSRSGEQRDHNFSDEPDEGGGVGVKYEQNQQQYDDEPLGKQEDDEDEYEEDSMAIHSRASTPRQEVHFPLGRSPGKQQNVANPVLRIPDFQQIFDNEEYDVFEDEDTPSFSDTTVTIPNKALDNMRLPIPAPGQMVMDSPAPWGKMDRAKSEDSDFMEIQPEAYRASSDSGGRSGLEKVTNTEIRLEAAGWQEEDDDEPQMRGETEFSNGYESKMPNEIDYDEEELIQQRENDGKEYYQAGYDDGNEGSDYDEQKDEPSIWSEGSPTISSRGWLSHVNKDTRKDLSPPKYGQNIKGKGQPKEQEYNNNELQKFEHRFQKQKLMPLTLRSVRPRDNDIVGEVPRLSPRAMAELAVQAAGRGPSKEVVITPKRKKGTGERRRSTSTGNSIDLTPLLSESELSALPTYGALVAALSTLRSKHHTTIPPSQLTSELDELATSYYPYDPRKPEKFFNKLDDKQHALAGEYILNKKRELEGKLEAVAAKRRRVVEGMKGDMEKAAEIRVVKLRKTEERRKLLQEGIGKMLREGGLWL